MCTSRKTKTFLSIARPEWQEKSKKKREKTKKTQERDEDNDPPTFDGTNTKKTMALRPKPTSCEKITPRRLFRSQGRIDISSTFR